MGELICYCFQHTAEDIKKDITVHGKSVIMAKIMEDKKAGRCQCKTKNPKGRWCLADVRQVVDRVMKKEGIKKPVDLQSLWINVEIVDYH